MNTEFLFWGVFVVLFVIVFLIDMTRTDKRKDALTVKTALFWSALWFSTAIIFGLFIDFFFPSGTEKSFEFFAAYLIEYSLSVDNLFVFILLFNVMGIPQKYQPRILKWGIVGAILLRIIFILAGVQLMKQFGFVIYIFGIILIYTAFHMLKSQNEKIDPETNLFVKLAKKFFPMKTDAASDHFFIKDHGKWHITIAFITLLLVESTDLIFAVDSIPAVLAITNDSFIAITSNLFAIIGLRSLFFALSGIINLFRFLKYGISFILLFIGSKMIASGFIHIPVQISLGIIILTLAISILASVMIKEKSSGKKRT